MSPKSQEGAFTALETPFLNDSAIGKTDAIKTTTLNTMNAADLRAVQIAHAAVGEVGGLSLALTIDRAWLELWHEYHKGVPFTLTAFAS